MPAVHPARVNLVTGALFVDDYLSRDSYDWGLDTLAFIPYQSDVEIDVQEGDTSTFAVDEDDLDEVSHAWRGYLASQETKGFEAATAQSGKARSGPRL